MTLAHSIKMTADQYLHLGEDPPGVRLELVDGEVFVSASPATVHAYVIAQLLRLLGNHISEHKLGILMSDTDHVLGKFDVRRPDLFYFTRARMRLIDEDVIRAAPDLAIEVISEGSEDTDRIRKFQQYQAFGIAHYWLIDPNARTAEAFQLKRKRYVAAGAASGNLITSFPPFPSFSLNLRDLWWPPQ